MAEFDQAQSPRLGQKVPPEMPGIQILSINTLPEVAPRGRMVWLADKDTIAVYDGVGWYMAGGPKTQTLISPTEPVADQPGDLWFNTTNSSLYVWSDPTGGTSYAWVLIVDPANDNLEATISQNQADAMAAIQELQDIVDGKVTTFYDSVQPTGVSVGDLWINTTTNRLYRYDPADTPPWTEIQDQDIVEALLAAGTAQATADGKIDSYYANDPPWANGAAGHALDEGDLWIDLNDSNRLYRWSGSAWVDVADERIAATSSQVADINNNQLPAIEAQLDQKVTTYFQSAFPWANGNTTHDVDAGDLFWDSDDKKVWRWGGATNRNWVSVTDPEIQAALDAAGTAQSTADGKINHYVSGTAPWANGNSTHDLDVGDIWTNTASGNLKYYWAVPARTWTQLPAGNAAITGDAMDNKTIIGPTIVAGANQYSGERIIIRPDGSGGIIEAFTGMAGETLAGVFNPIVYQSRPAISIKAGATSTYSDQSELILLSSTSGFAASYLFTDYLYLQASNTVNVSNNMSVLGTLGVSGDASFSTNITVGGSINGTMNSGGVGTGTFRDAVDSRVRATAMSGLTSGLSVSNGFDLNGGGSISGGMTLNGGITMGTNPTISGATTFSSPLTVSNSITASGASGTVEGVRVYARTPNGTTNAANVRWDSTGGEYKQVTASALKYKENITDAEIDTDALLKIRPRAYDYKKDYAPDAGPQIGLVADELDALGLTAWVVYDEATGEIEDVNYARLTVPLIALVKKQQARLDSLEERLSAAGL